MIEVFKKILIASVTVIPKLENSASAFALVLGSIRKLMFAVFAIVTPPNILFTQLYIKSFTIATQNN